MTTRIYTLPLDHTRWRVPSGGTSVFNWEYDEARDRLATKLLANVDPARAEEVRATIEAGAGDP